MNLFRLLFGSDEPPSPKREGLTAEMKLAIQEAVDNRLNNPPASFDEQLERRVERHLKMYKVYFWVITLAGPIILGIYGLELKPTVLKEINDTLARRNVDDLINKVVGDEVDKIARPEITKEIDGKINPQLLKLSSDTANLSAQILKLSYTNNDNSELIVALNQDKHSYSNLLFKSTHSNPPDTYLFQMLGTIKERAQFDANFCIKTSKAGPDEGTTPTMGYFALNFYTNFSVNPFYRSALLKECWQSTNNSEKDKAGFLIAAMKYDNNIVVEYTASILLSQVGNAGQDFINMDVYDNWFQNNTNYFANNADYLKWVETNQFIKK